MMISSHCRCVSRSDGSGWRMGDVIQNVVRGESPQCPLVNSMGDDADNGIVLGGQLIGLCDPSCAPQ